MHHNQLRLNQQDALFVHVDNKHDQDELLQALIHRSVAIERKLERCVDRLEQYEEENNNVPQGEDVRLGHQN